MTTAAIAIFKAHWKPLALITLVAFLIWGFSHWRYTAGQDDANAAWQLKWAQRDTADAAANEQRAETITSNVITSMRIINTITRANADAKQQIQNESETRIVYIRQSLSGERCAANHVPADVVNRLREHAYRIRASSGGTDSRRIAD